MSEGAAGEPCTHAPGLAAARSMLRRIIGATADQDVPAAVTDDTGDPPPSALEAPARVRQPGRFLRKTFAGATGVRAYRLYIPAGYDGQPCPLVVMLHGCTQTPDDFAAGTQMNELADEFALLVAYPEQSVSANASRCWNWFNLRDQQRGRGEPSIVAGITAQIMQEYRVDRARVYAAGMSAGAAAAAVLGAAYPDLYAAIGVHSGLAHGIAHDMRSGLALMRGGDGAVDDVLAGGPEAVAVIPVPTIVFHGDRDGTVHPRNGERFFNLAVTHDCERYVSEGNVPGGRAFTRTTFTAPDGRIVLEQWVVHGGAHAWSGGSASGSYTDPRGPSASREMVRFFLTHRLNGAVRVPAVCGRTQQRQLG